jgi:hypothetical protein
MRKVRSNIGATGLALIGGMALGMSGTLAQAAGTASPPAAAAAQETPGAAAQAQIQFTEEQRNKLKQALATGEKQSKPTAFMPAAGQSVPQDVSMQSLPQEAHQEVPQLTEQHQFARMDDGTIVIADKDRNIVATLQEDGATTGMSPGTGASPGADTAR